MNGGVEQFDFLLGAEPNRDGVDVIVGSVRSLRSAGHHGKPRCSAPGWQWQVDDRREV